MADGIDKAAREAFDIAYKKGHTDGHIDGFAAGYAAGIADVLSRIQSLADKAGVPASSVAPLTSTNIRVLGLTIRSAEALRSNGIRTVEDIYALAKDPRDVTAVLQGSKGLGYRSIVEINAKLLEHGYPEIGEPSRW